MTRPQSPAASQALISVNGKILSPEKALLSALDSGVLAGFGVFETVLSYGKRPFRLAEHLARFEKSRCALGLRRRFSQPDIEAFIGEALEQFSELLSDSRSEKKSDDERYCRIRVLLTGGNTGDGLWGVEALDGSLIIIVREHTLPSESMRPAAEIISSAASLHWLAQHKTLSRMLFSHPAPQKLSERGARSGNGKRLRILYHPAVGVTEFSVASLFVRRGARVISAPDKNVFPGICRSAILKHWDSLASDFELELRKIEISDLLGADEVIGVNSLRAAFALSQLSDNSNAADSSSGGSETSSYKKPALTARLRRFLLNHSS